MAMDQEMIAALNQETQPPWVLELLTKVKAMVELSRSAMMKRYDDWDNADLVYRGERELDDKDRKAQERGEPTKFVIPMTYSQTETFIAFMMSVMFQREYFFELTPFSVESTRAEKLGEALLQRDLDHNNFVGRCRQFFLDLGRFGLAVFKPAWTEELQLTSVETPATSTEFLGLQMQVPGEVNEQWLPKFQGNRISNISPYRWFPDPRVTIQDFQDGEFVASESEVSYMQLRERQQNGVAAGVKYIQSLTKYINSQDNVRKQGRWSASLSLSDNARPFSGVGGTGIETEVQVKLIPADFTVGGKATPMGDQDYPTKWIVTYVNDNRIIRIEPLAFDHDKFTYSAAQFSPDIHHFTNFALSDLLSAMQDVVTWFVNSHITSVRKVIQNWIVFDPDAVERSDIEERRSAIRMIPGKNRLGIDSHLKQLQVVDVTSRHMDDAAMLQQQSQMTTGISDNALGQFFSGRRSATEAKNVNAATASRLKMIASITYYDAFEPMGRQMLSNLRQGLTMQAYVKQFGTIKDPTMDAYFEFVKASREDLIGEYDFEIYDGTLPSEKVYSAQALQEVLPLLVSDPQIAMVLGFDIKSIFYEMLVLRGIRHPERFSISEAQRKAVMLQMVQQYAGQQGAPGAGAQTTPNGTAPQAAGVTGQSVVPGVGGATGAGTVT